MLAGGAVHYFASTSRIRINDIAQCQGKNQLSAASALVPYP